MPSAGRNAWWRLSADRGVCSRPDSPGADGDRLAADFGAHSEAGRRAQYAQSGSPGRLLPREWGGLRHHDPGLQPDGLGFCSKKTPLDIIGERRWKRGFGTGLAIWTACASGWPPSWTSPYNRAASAGPRPPRRRCWRCRPCSAWACQTFAEEFVFRGYLTQALLLAIKRPSCSTALVSGLDLRRHAYP